MRIADPYLEELTMEASTTRRVLERVPEKNLNWRPHEKSMSLGQLALHVATLPRQLTEFVTGDELDFGAAAGAPPTVVSHHELLAAFNSSTERARSYLANLSDERATATWRLTAGGVNCSRHRALLCCAHSCSITGTTIADSWSSTCVSSMCPCRRSTDQPPTRTRLRAPDVVLAPRRARSPRSSEA